MHRYRSTCMDKGVLSCLLSGGGHQKPDWLQEEHHGPVGRGEVVPLRAGDCALQGAHAVNPDNHRCLFFDLHDPICPSPDHTHLQLPDDCNQVHVPGIPFMSFEWMCTEKHRPALPHDPCPHSSLQTDPALTLPSAQSLKSTFNKMNKDNKGTSDNYDCNVNRRGMKMNIIRLFILNAWFDFSPLFFLCLIWCFIVKLLSCYI